MKKSGVRRGVLVYKGPDPAGKMEIPVSEAARDPWRAKIVRRNSSRIRVTCRAALLPSIVCVVALVLAAKGITNEAAISMNGDMPRHLMNGVYFYDLMSDGVPSDVMQHARRYFAQYPALTLGHHPVLLPLAEAPFFALFGISVASGRLTMLFFLVPHTNVCTILE